MQTQYTKSKQITLAGLFVALGLIIPFATAHAVGIPGSILLPMHLPVLLCGFICGPQLGMLCGMVTPVISSLLTGMPPLFPNLVLMFFELSCYGLFSGLFYRKYKLNIYLSLIGAMISGRVAYGIVFAVLFNLNGGALKALSVWGAASTGMPGMVIQLLLVPIIVKALQRHYNFGCSTLDKAKNMIATEVESCMLLKKGKIIYAVKDRGVDPLLNAYDHNRELMEDAFLVDKIIGKAAAMIAICGGVTSVYGEVMSVSAKEYLKEHGVAVSYGRCVEVISNRTGNGICPIEKSVMEIDDPLEGYHAIVKRLDSLKQQAVLEQAQLKNA